MKIWLRAAPWIVSSIQSGIGVVFHSLHKAFKLLHQDITLDDPKERCIEIWVGWDWSPERNGNLLVGFSTGETQLSQMASYNQFDVIFVYTKYYAEWQDECLVAFDGNFPNGCQKQQKECLVRFDRTFGIDCRPTPTPPKGGDGQKELLSCFNTNAETKQECLVRPDTHSESYCLDGQKECLVRSDRTFGIGCRNGQKELPVYVWPLGVDTSLFPVLQRNWSPFIFAHVGASQFRKGSDIACEAFDLEFNEDDDVFLDIISVGETEMFRQLKNQYYQNKKIRFIIRCLSREDVYQNYYGNCLLFPSLREGWGLCLTEAMSTGMPAIVSLIPPLMEQFSKKSGWWIKMSDKPSGIFTMLPDINDLRKKMRYAYEHPEVCKIKGSFAATYVRNNLTWGHGITRNFLPVVNKLCALCSPMLISSSTVDEYNAQT